MPSPRIPTPPIALAGGVACMVTCMMLLGGALPLVLAPAWAERASHAVWAVGVAVMLLVDLYWRPRSWRVLLPWLLPAWALSALLWLLH